MTSSAKLIFNQKKSEEEEMSPQEVGLKKATLDKMIAMRKQQLDKSKAEPTKAMGETKELVR